VGMKELMFVVSTLHTNSFSVRFEVLTADTMKSTVLSDVMSYNLIGRCQNLVPSLSG
jgi:hypothetical protein